MAQDVPIPEAPRLSHSHSKGFQTFSFSKSGLGNLTGVSRNVRYMPEKTTWTWVQTHKKSLLAGQQWSWVFGIPVSHEIFSKWTFKNKNHILGWHTLLARIVSQKHNYRSQKARFVHLGTFPESGTLIGYVFILILAGVATYLDSKPEWFFRHDISCAKVWWSVALILNWRKQATGFIVFLGVFSVQS